MAVNTIFYYNNREEIVVIGFALFIFGEAAAFGVIRAAAIMKCRPVMPAEVENS